MTPARPKHDIPGTTLFDSVQVRKVHSNYHIPISNTACGLLAVETVH